MTHIVRVRVENILGAKEIEFQPNGQSVTIGGENGQGKSSAIRALVMALGGKEQVPEKPVREGAEFGEVICELDKFNVFLEVQPDRTTKLRVESKEGFQVSKPQQMLNDLFGALSFDPGEFRSMSAAERLTTLRDLVGLDFSALDKESRQVYEERTDIGRQVREVEGKLKGRSVYADAPAEEVSIAALSAEHEVAIAANRAKEQVERQHVQAQTQADALLKEADQVSAEINRLGAKLAELRELAAKREKESKDLYAQFDAMPLADTESIREKMKHAEATNAKVRENKETATLHEKLSKLQEASNARTRRLEEIKVEKAQQLAGAAFPIAGLGFDEADATFNGLPFAQLSESEQWEVSTAIGFALGQRSILFMANSGGLDKKSRQRIRERAAALGVQLFLECVDDQEDVQILIEDGTVKENRLQVAQEVAA